MLLKVYFPPCSCEAGIKKKKWLQYSIVTIINNVQVIIKLPNNIDIKFINMLKLVFNSIQVNCDAPKP